MPTTSYSRRDHFVTATFAANEIGREGGDGSAQRGRSVCLVLFCVLRAPGRRNGVDLGGHVYPTFLRGPSCD